MKQERILLVILIVLIVIMSLLSDKFFTVYNFLEMTRYFVEVGLIALGMTFLIISRGIDLSVGSVVGLCAVILGYSWKFLGLNIWLATVFVLGCGILAGLGNAFLIAKLSIPPLIVTLATLAVYRGLACGISQAQPVHDYPPEFFFLGQGYLGPFPFQFLIFVLLALVAGLILSRTRWGRGVYGLGLNETAVRFSGIPVTKIKIFLYLLSGFLSALAAVIFVSRVSTAKADAGAGYELDVITAVVLGGTDINGGQGTIGGTVLGLLVISVLRNGLTLARFPGEGQTVLVGLILISSVILQKVFKTE